MSKRNLFITLVVILGVLVLMGMSVSGKSPFQSANNGKIKWPASQALPSFAKPKQLDVIDLDGKAGDEKILFATLQGNVNREGPRIYLIEDRPGEGKYTWLRDLEIPYTVVNEPWVLLTKYKNEVSGIVIYDPEVPDSINVATTMAGLKNAVVASPELAETLTEAPYNYAVVDDLRGKFKDKMDAYRWQYEHLWPEATHRMLVGLGPTRGVPLPPGNFDSFRVILEEKEEIRDSSNRDVYELDLSEFLGEDAVYVRFQDAFTADGWGPAVHKVTVIADGETIAEFIPDTAEERPFLYDRDGSSADSRFDGHRWADNGHYFVYKFTPPEGTEEFIIKVDMWNQFKVSASNVQPVSSERGEPYGFLRDYAVANRAMVVWFESNVPEERELFEQIMSETDPNSPYLGWFSNDVAGEFSGTELVSEHEMYVVPADWFNNLTVFSGAKGKIKKQKPVKAPPLENKIYITFTLGEGDNLQYNQHHMRHLWDNDRRGTVPINWSTSPLLYDAAPAILAYYQETATENDLLIAGPSGAGYIYPSPWPEESFDVFAKQTGKYMQKTGMDIIYALNRIDHRDVMLSDTVAQAYIDEAKLHGIFLGWDSYTETTILNEKLPQSILLSASSVGEAQERIARATEEWDGESPLFIAMGMLSWSINPAHIEEIANSLGPDFVPVRGDQYFDLVKEANGLKRKN